MIISVSLTDNQLATIDELRKENGETRSGFMVRRALAAGPERPPSRRQLRVIAKRARAAILGKS